MSQSTDSIGQKVEDGAKLATEVAEAGALATGNPEFARMLKGIADAAQTALSTAQAAAMSADRAHAKANDALDQLATPAPTLPHDSLLQEIVDFLHRLFPGHNAPGSISEPPPPAA